MNTRNYARVCGVLAMVMLVAWYRPAHAGAPNVIEGFLKEPRQPDRVIVLGSRAQVYSFALSPDGKTAYAHLGRAYPGIEGVRDELIAIDVDAARVTRVIASPSGLDAKPYEEGMLLSPNGKSLLVFSTWADEGQPLRLVSLETGKVTWQTRVDRPPSSSRGWQPMFSNDSRSVYFTRGSEHQALVGWDTIANRETSRLALPEVVDGEEFYILSLRPRGDVATTILSTWVKDRVEVGRWDPVTNKLVPGLRTPAVHVYCGIEPPPVAASLKRFYAIVQDDKDWARPPIHVWDLASGRKQEVIMAPDGFECRRLIVNQDDQLLLARATEPDVAVYDVPSATWTQRLTWGGESSRYMGTPDLVLADHTLLALLPARHNTPGDTGADSFAVFNLVFPSDAPGKPRP